MTDKIGETITQSLAEIDKCMTLCNYHYKNSDNFLDKKNIKTEYSNSYYVYFPLDVTFGIMPWNLPLLQVLCFVIFNLVLVNTMLFKHSPNSNGVSLAIEKWRFVAFLTNVFKTIIIDVSVVKKILKHKLIAGVSMTSFSIVKIAGENIKKSVLELCWSRKYCVSMYWITIIKFWTNMCCCKKDNSS